MRRKVGKHGTATLTVSLPAKWVKQHEIKAGDEVEVQPEKDSLTIYTKERIEKTQEKRITIDLSDCDDINYTGSVVGALYRLGYDIIKIKFKTPKTLSDIEYALQTIIGYEIVEQDINQCIIKNLVKDAETELQNLINKLFSICKVEFTIINECCDKGFSSIDQIRSLRISAWKIRNYALRLLYKYEEKNPQLFALGHIIFTLEKISASLFRTFEVLFNNKVQSNEEFNKVFKAVQSYVEYFQKNWHKTSLEINKTIRENKNPIIHTLVELSAQQKKELEAYMYLRDIVNSVFSLNSSHIMLNFEEDEEKIIK